ncbi:hypothetical protein I3843_07G088600 [Carya illinoinensis]|nr:hypothetical protein I3843_07G088600 [Carya illinoinensis]
MILRKVVGRFITPDVPSRTPATALDKDAITVGEALEASSLSAGNKPVEQITGKNEVTPGGVAAMAQSAADINPQIMPDQAKMRLLDILSDASARLPGDKAVTREDAERVIGVEIRNRRDMSTTPGGVAESMAPTARLNQNKY